MITYEDIGVKKLINAVDTYTIIGGSLMPDEVLNAMVEAGKSFVDLEELHEKAGQFIARLTKNESAFVTNGAAAGLAIATAACITGTNPAIANKLPNLQGLKNEVIVHRSQRNGYDHAIRQVGVDLIEIGNVDVTYTWELEDAITDQTACIIYFSASTFSKGALPLEQVIEIAQKYDVPVIVDAAAQLPPLDNLWRYTEMGADAAIFSGGKTLRGPQSTGLILGKKELIEACRLNSNPRHSIGRSMKVGKEEIMGLLAAINRYVNLDHEKVIQELEDMVSEMMRELTIPGSMRVERIFPGPVGQTYPRAAVYLEIEENITALEMKEELEQGDPGVMVGITEDHKGIIINPLNLEWDELSFVISQVKSICSKHQR